MPPGISGSTASTTTRRLDDDREVEPIPQHRASEAGRSLWMSPVPTAAQDAYGSEAAAHALANFNDGILYVGMNPLSMETESDALDKARGKPVEHVFAKEGATVTFDGTSYDLKATKQIDAFAHALARKHALPDSTASALSSVLQQATEAGRDELAQIAMVWARGERGQQIPSRLVLSGHHAGGSFSGLKDSSVFGLARVFPTAAKQIQDVHFAGCMSEEHVNVRDDIKHAFPNVKTVWGYSGYSPEAPVHHLLAWERATRGNENDIKPWSVPGHESAVAWSEKGGIVGKQRPIEERRRECRDADTRFESYKSGRMPNTWMTDADYASYQAIAQSNVPEGEKNDAKAKAAVLLRVRKYDHVREKFDEAYGARIRAASARAGIEPPNFRALPRKDALERIEAIKEKVAAFDPELRRALVGLAELDSNVVVDGWCY